tara:strand:+ start:58 stop:399 length:342 start_codon:yes stop_codon:yes gene_type:complete
MSKKIISVTCSALKQLKQIAKFNNSNGILFSVKSGGCNGFEYKFEPINTSSNEGHNIVVEDDLKIEVCEKSLFYLLGTKIDWDEDIMGRRFIFDNPMAEASCGCGTSFSMGNL